MWVGLFVFTSNYEYRSCSANTEDNLRRSLLSRTSDSVKLLNQIQVQTSDCKLNDGAKKRLCNNICIALCVKNNNL